MNKMLSLVAGVVSLEMVDLAGYLGFVAWPSSRNLQDENLHTLIPGDLILDFS